jgi:hypothetical protein
MNREYDKDNISVVTTRLITIILEMSLTERVELLEELENSRHRRSRRKYPRAIYLSEVEIYAQGRSQRGVIKNMTPEGMFIRTDRILFKGEPIKVTFKLPNSEDLIQISAVVVRNLPDGIGIKFKLPILEYLK